MAKKTAEKAPTKPMTKSEIVSGIANTTGLAKKQVSAVFEAMGGQIWVESQVGQGSTFYFTASIERGRQKAKMHPIKISGIERLRVLVVNESTHNLFMAVNNKNRKIVERSEL